MDAFISYRRKPSAALAMLLQEKLRNQYKIDAYVDTTRTDSTKVSFPERLMEAIGEAPVFVCLLGEGTLDSEWVLKEIVEAHRLKKRCIPVFQESYSPQPAPSEAVNYLLSFDGVHVMDMKNIFIDESVKQLGLLIKPRSKQKLSLPLVFGTLITLVLIVASIFVLPRFLPQTTAIDDTEIASLTTEAPTNTTEPTDSPTNTNEPTDSPTNTNEPTDSPTNTNEPTDSPTNTNEPTDSPTNTNEPTIPTATTDTTVRIPREDTPQSICLVTDVGRVNDGTFNQLAYEGISAAAVDYELNFSFIETSNYADYAANIAACIDSDFEIIVTVGFLLQDATIAAAMINPDVFFIGIDQNTSFYEDVPANFIGLNLREDQSAYLVGVIAALVADINSSNTIAGVYGVDIPAIKRYRNGFEQGALLVKPDWIIGQNILSVHADSFIDTEQGISLAQDMIANGAGVIFAAAGPTGSAAILEAASQGIYVIGAEFDEYDTTFASGGADGSQYIISSALKSVDVGIYDLLALLQDNPQAWNTYGGGDYFYNHGHFASAHDSDIDPVVYDFVEAVQTLLAENCISTNVDYATGDLLSEAEIAAFVPAEGCDELAQNLMAPLTNNE